MILTISCYTHCSKQSGRHLHQNNVKTFSKCCHKIDEKKSSYIVPRKINITNGVDSIPRVGLYQDTKVERK